MVREEAGGRWSGMQTTFALDRGTTIWNFGYATRICATLLAR